MARVGVYNHAENKKLRDVQQEREGAGWSKFLQVMKHFKNAGDRLLQL